MLEKSQEYLRLAISAAAILIGLSVAYHYMIYIPEKDRQQQLQLTAKAEAASLQATAREVAAEKAAKLRRANFDLCRSTAFANYNNRWNASCKRLADEVTKNRADCLANGGSEAWCNSTYPSRPTSDCSLPSSMSDAYDTMLKDDQKLCLDQANAGVFDADE